MNPETKTDAKVLRCAACDGPIAESQLRINIHGTASVIHEERKCIELLNRKNNAGKPAPPAREEKPRQYNPYKHINDLNLAGCAWINQKSKVVSWQSNGGSRSCTLSKQDLILLISAFKKAPAKSVLPDGLTLKPGPEDKPIHSISSGLISLRANEKGEIFLCLGKAESASLTQIPVLRPRLLREALEKANGFGAYTAMRSSRTKRGRF